MCCKYKVHHQKAVLVATRANSVDLLLRAIICFEQPQTAHQRKVQGLHKWPVFASSCESTIFRRRLKVSSAAQSGWKDAHVSPLPTLAQQSLHFR